MKFLFEDNREDQLSQLFLYLYQDSPVLDDIIYTEGNAALSDFAEEFLRSGEKVVAFLDVLPGNVEIWRIYFDLCKLSATFNYNLIVIPIVSAEHCFLKSVIGTALVKDVEALQSCVDLQPMYHPNVVSTEQDRKFCKTYEKYCKLVLRKCLYSCFKTKLFTTRDCVIIEKVLTLEEKATNLLRHYPCFPPGSRAKDANLIYWDDIWDIHRKCIDNVNTLNNKFQEAGKPGRYKTYKYIKEFS